MRRSLTMLAISLVVAAGCAPTHLPAAHVTPGAYEGRIIESVRLKDGHTVRFDRWNSASAGPDKRARIQGNAVTGYVDGAHRVVNLSDVEELHFGVDDRTGTQIAIMTALVAAALVSCFLFLAYTISHENGW